MMKTLKTIVAAAAVTVASGMAADASPIYAPVPTTNYITIGSVDWAWASPCSADASSCSSIDLSYQSTLGWRLPTVSEMVGAIAAAGGSYNWSGLFGHGAICASAWFDNNYAHCDGGDADAGYIWNTPTVYGYFDETFAIRGLSQIPVPAALPLLLVAVGGFGAFVRRRKSA